MQVLVNDKVNRKQVEGELIKRNNKSVIVRLERNSKPHDVKRKINRDYRLKGSL